MDYTIALPSKPRIVSEEDNKGIYEIDGLYAGYGHTLGNSLRRIILSSLFGAAITKIKIEGVSHEFSTLSGVKEDTITIMLNLKNVRFKMHTDEPQDVSISVSGNGEVTAKDLKTSSELEVLNKDQHIATLTDKNTKFEAEIRVEKGLGYVSRELVKEGKTEVGVIIPDAVFTPIKRVHYEVENMRVGDRTDYNRLRIFIQTDGSVSPKEALEESVAIMIKHLKAVVGFKEEEEIITPELGVEVEGSKDSEGEIDGDKADEEEILKTRVEDLQLSSRTLNALSEAGIRTVGGLVRKKESDLLELEGVGKKVVQEIRRALGNLGLILK